MDDLAKQAISMALNRNWEGAVLLNRKILQENDHDIEALLRLSYAYYSLGDIKKSQFFARKALRVDPGNHMAKQCMEKCNMFKPSNKRESVGKINLKAFVENKGKSKITKLVHTGTPSVIASLVPGESLSLVIAPNKVSVESLDGAHVGRFTDDIANKIWSNRAKKHEAVFKSFNKQDVSVVLTEG